MRTNIFWESHEYNSMEHCSIQVSNIGTTVDSVIMGAYHGQVFRTSYHLVINPNWETELVSVTHQSPQQEQHIELKSGGLGIWHLNGQLIDDLNGCIDIDIPLTPFTNTLPINRLRPTLFAEHKVRVVYIDLLNQQIMPLYQKYYHQATHVYHYENIPNNFEADITVDDMGLVVHYPGLFERVGYEIL